MYSLSKAELASCPEPLNYGDCAIVISPDDLARFEEVCRMGVERIDDWEFFLLIGLEQNDVLSVADEIRRVLLEIRRGGE